MKKIIAATVLSTLIVAPISTVNANPGHHHHPHKTIKILPKGAKRVVLSGSTYWLSGGIYYRKKGNVFLTVKIPIGSRVKALPHGAVVVKVNGRQYFHHAGIYYRWRPAKSHYEVVRLEAKKFKVGSRIEQLPAGAEVVFINQMQYFYYQGNHFLPTVHKGKHQYLVVKID